MAAQKGHLAVVQLLVGSGANMDPGPPEDGQMPLEFVIRPISSRDPMTTLEYLAVLEAPACHVSNMCHCFASKSKTHQLCMFFFFFFRGNAMS